MKHRLYAVTTLLGAVLAGPALAQSSVQLYGYLDSGLEYVSNVGGRSITQAGGGALAPERIGLRGTEDLGRGLKAGFRLESGILTHRGSLVNNSRMFNRESSVFFGSEDMGTISFGRMPDLMYEYVPKFLSPPAPSALVNKHPGNWDNYASQYQFSNSVKYESPEFSGFSIGAMYGFGESQFEGPKAITKSLGLRFRSGAWRMSATHSEHRNRAVAIRALTGVEEAFGMTLPMTPLVVDTVNNTAVGVSYRASNFILASAFSYTRMKLDDRTANQRNYDIGGTYFFPKGMAVQLMYTHSNLDGARWDQVTALGAYSLSKRTKLYVKTMYQHASGEADYAAMQNIGVASGRSQTVVNMGISHMF